MSCRNARSALAVWDPGAGDLPEPIALHLDACEACGAHFDQVFRPWRSPPDPVPAALRRHFRVDRPSPWTARASMVATAAALLLTVASPGAVDSARADDGATCSVADVVGHRLPPESLLEDRLLLPWDECPVG